MRSESYRRIWQSICRDPGGRGILGCLTTPDLDGVGEAIARACRVAIVTGFPIAGAGIGETDGPPGAACIAAMLQELGKDVTIVSDAMSVGLVRACAALCAPKAAVVETPMTGERPSIEADLVISIERPGRGADGHYHNMHGEIIDSMVADTDWMLGLAASIAIGDGGNELGMADVNPTLSALRADYTLVAGVSNWWAWGLCAIMSVKTGLDLLPSDDRERRILAACVAAGGVDGVTRRRTPSVDGLPFETSLEVLRELRRAAVLPAVL